MGARSYLMAIPLADGGIESVVVEVDPRDIPAEMGLAGAKSGEIVAKARRSLESALDEIRPAVGSIVDWVEKVVPEAPTECCVEFGLKLGGQTSVIIASGTAEVNFVIKLTWKKQ